MLALYLSVIETQEDKDKFAQMYIDHKQTMYAVAFIILKNETDTEDAVHQAFLKIAKNFTKISQKSSQEMKGYLVIICRNTAIDMYRSNRRVLEKNVYMEQDDIPDVSSFENADYEFLYSAIKKLSQKYKDVIYLCDLGGFSAKEAADILNTSTDVIYKRLERARTQIKKSLEKGEIHAE